jgi:stage II sporulation protein D
VRIEFDDLAVNSDRAVFRPEQNGDLVVRWTDEPTAYEGRIEISVNARGQLNVVNVIALEDYVASVVASEYSLETGEGMKAIAIVARTYALSAAAVAPDGIRGQAYGGVDAVTPASREATLSTDGAILEYEGAPIHALYSASNGGSIANSADVWGGASLPYTSSGADPFDLAASPHLRWTSSLNRREVIRALQDQFGPRIRDFEINMKGPDGRVRDVVLIDERKNRSVISGNSFRLAIIRKLGGSALRSTLFELERDGETLTFTGSGYGHGAGLSQWGAYAMAREGQSAEQILAFYFPGASLSEGGATVTFPLAAAIVDVSSETENGPDGRLPSEAEGAYAPASASNRDGPDMMTDPPRRTSGWSSGLNRGRAGTGKRIGW